MQKNFYNNRDYATIFKLDKRMKTIMKFLPICFGGKLLDVGCSDGKISSLFFEKGYDVYGVDISDKALKKATKRGIKVTKADITKELPYSDAEFDTVFCGEVLEHILDPMFLLNEIFRVLEDKGSFVVTVPNISMLRNAFLILVGSLPCYACIYDGPHVRDYCMKIVVEMLNKVGFRDIKVSGDRMSIPYGSGKDISLPPLIPRFCDYLIIRCKK